MMQKHKNSVIERDDNIPKKSKLKRRISIAGKYFVHFSEHVN
jgi:hypothetical protein